ncbi:unnamed protein product [Rotaria magnacalcarata]|uniref:Serine/threonine-protein phosphatase n=2 Tax=Rotaria magnacalcarata TaxID=392030 RepID=A0A816WC91_9BILA|nr:unnamed protein product [Rotaria magnacalcarata]
MTYALRTNADHESALKIQGAFRNHQARLKLKEQAVWQIHEKLEYSSEQTQAKLRDLFVKLINSSDLLSPSVTKLLQRVGLPVEEEELLRSTNPDNISVESSYQGPRIEGPITGNTLIDLIEAFQHGQVLHAKYVCKILHQARFILKSLPNFNRIDLSDLHHVFIIGDLHGQLADLLHIFNENGLPGTDNPYIFNGDFVDRGEQSVEIILLLMVSLILYPSSLFLNRGNHEDIMVTARYGFQKEVTQKYQSVQKPLFDLFKDVFSWLPMYSYVKTGKTRIIIIHGGISDRINLTTINSLRRNRYISMEIPPKSEHGEAHLTADEKNEYHQVEDLLWSDPDPKGLHGSRKNDSRNIGCFFGSDITDQFLKKNNFSMLIRSHQVKEKGYEFAHHRKVITVFSASNYEKGSNSGAILRWGYNEDEPRIIQHKLQRAQDMQALSFDKQVTLLEDPAYQALIEKIMAKKSSLQKEFDKADRNQTAHLPVIVWSKIMTNVLEADLPWFTLRSKLVEEDAQGVRYNTMFDGYALYNTKFQMSHTGIMEDLYMWKDTLLMLFNLIDSNHSGFIDAEEFADIIKLLLSDEDGAGNVSQKYIDELCSAIDLDGNGKIDANEFLESFRIVNSKQSQNPDRQPNRRRR